MPPTRLLYVGSDSSSNLSYQLLLESYGFAVDTAKNSRAAMSQLGSSAVEVVVISQDIRPASNGSGGFQLAADIKRHSPEIPVVMISGCKSVVEDAPRFVDGAFWNSAPVAGLVELLQNLALRPAVKRVLSMPTTSGMVGLPASVA